MYERAPHPFVRGRLPYGGIGHDPDTLKDAFMNEAVIRERGAYADAPGVVGNMVCMRSAYTASCKPVGHRNGRPPQLDRAANAALANPAGGSRLKLTVSSQHTRPAATPRNACRKRIANAMPKRDCREKPSAFTGCPSAFSLTTASCNGAPPPSVAPLAWRAIIQPAGFFPRIERLRDEYRRYGHNTRLPSKERPATTGRAAHAGPVPNGWLMRPDGRSQPGAGSSQSRCRNKNHSPFILRHRRMMDSFSSGVRSYERGPNVSACLILQPATAGWGSSAMIRNSSALLRVPLGPNPITSLMPALPREYLPRWFCQITKAGLF